MKTRIFTYIMGFFLLPMAAMGQAPQSDIVETSGYSYMSHINYINYMGSGIIHINGGNAAEVASFTIRDGGGIIDSDNNGTVLTDLTFDFSYPEFIYAIAIFDGPNNIAQRYQDPTFPDTLQFHNLNLIAPDNGSKTFTVKVVFTDNVIDRERLVISIQEAIADPTGSFFGSHNAGGASSSASNGNNRIEVSATKLIFTTQPSSTAYKGMKLGMQPVVSAIDANAVVDLDYTSDITLVSTSGLGMLNHTVIANEGQASFNNLIITSKGTTFLQTNNPMGLEEATSRAVTVINVPQKKWDGQAGTSDWFDPLNWYPDGLPDDGDNVVLDNQYVLTSYTINMDQSMRQDIKFLTLTPGLGKKIKINIPSTNLSDTALYVIGEAGNKAVTLNSGGEIMNSSIVDNGNYAFAIGNGTFTIRNGGCYIHASNTPHADLAMKLSTAFGTEKGIFKFDVPLTGQYEVFADGAIYGTLSLQSTMGVVEYMTANSGTMTVRGDLEVLPLAEFYPTIDAIIVKGDLASSSIFDPSANTWIVMNGTEAQHVNGTGSMMIDKFEINNSSVDGVTLGRPLAIDNNVGADFRMTLGRLFTSTTNMLHVPENAVVSGGNLYSFVHGPMSKTVNNMDKFNMPVGKDTLYRVLGIEPTSTDMTTFFAEYFYNNPDFIGYDTSMRDSILKRVSGIEYWSLTRSAASTPTDAFVTLTWSTASGVTPGYENQMRVAHWDGSKWNSKGGNPIDGTAARGYVTSDPEVSSFGIFTLGSLTRINPLPVELIAFEGELMHRDVKLDWMTAMEENNRGFEIQRSLDGDNWAKIGWKDGHGTYMGELEYDYLDANVIDLKVPVIYYRLKQIDYNGAYAYSNVISVRMQAEQFAVEQAWINNHEQRLYFNMSSSYDGNVDVMISDVLGRVVFQKSVFVTSGNSMTSVDVPPLPEGINIVRIGSGTDAYSQKIYNSR